MSTEVFIQFNEEGEPDHIIPHGMIIAQPRVELCHVYTQDEYIHMMRVGGNNEAVARFAGKLIGDLGFRIPHPEFYPDEYTKFEEDWKAFTEFAKNHKRIMELQDRQALLLQERIDYLLDNEIPFDLEEWAKLLDGNIEDLRKLGVYPND